MINFVDLILVLIMLTSLALLGTSRLTGCIRIVAWQGMLLALLPVALCLNRAPTLRAVLLSAGILIVKGWIFPKLLHRAIREADTRKEIEPYTGYLASLGWGAFAFAMSLWIGSRLPIPYQQSSSMVVSVGLYTILVGLFLIVSRKKAITQVLGYLTLENGIYALGITLAYEQPLLVELGILLDVFAAVFVMGIAVFHINREFDDLSTERLSALKD